MPKTILVVDDEERLTSLLDAYLRREGFRVVIAADGTSALHQARAERPDLIVLDIMMPEMDGLEFLRRHRQEANTPVILLTARVDEDDRVVGLELGADDYVTKPFRPRELLARIRAVLRRVGRGQPGAVLEHRGIVLDHEAHRVLVDGRAVELTPSEFELLAALLSSPGKVFRRIELLELIQGVGYAGYARTIDAHVKNLRAKLGSPDGDPWIETVYGVGYRMADGS